jgi:DNA-binding NarL/FixJ family response regulator
LFNVIGSTRLALVPPLLSLEGTVPKSRSDVARAFFALSARQQEVVSLVCDEQSNKEIAAKLDVTEGTVKAHLHAIYAKLHVRSRNELRALAHRGDSRLKN